MPKQLPNTISDFSNKDYVPIGKAAEILGVSIDTVRRWNKQGKLHSVRPNKNRLFLIKELKNLNSNKTLSITQAAHLVGVSSSTLRRYENKGLIKPKRTKRGDRAYSKSTIEKFVKSKSSQVRGRKKLVPISKAAVILNVSKDTIRRWDKKGKLHSVRPDGKNRYFSKEDLELVKVSRPLKISEAARFIGVSPSTLRRHEKAGLVSVRRNTAGVRVYDKDDLKNYLQQKRKVVKPEKVPEPVYKLKAEDIPQLYQSLHLAQKKAFAVVLASLLIAVIGFSVWRIPIVKNKIGQTISNIIGPPDDGVQIAEALELKELRGGGRELDSQRGGVNVESTFGENVVLDKKLAFGGGVQGVCNLDVDGDTHDIAGTLTLSGDTLTSSDDLLIDPAGDDVTVGGDLILSDTFTLQVGGLTGTPYNALANIGEAPEQAEISSDNDLYIGGDLEVDGLIFGDGSNLTGVSSYTSWTFAVDGSNQDAITDLDVLDFVSGEGIDVSRSADDKITIAGEDATVTNKGIASFSDSFFSVSSGAVSIDDIYLSNTGDIGTGTYTFTGQVNVDNLRLDGNTLSSTSGNLILSPTGSLVFSGFDCTGNANGGTLTADASGVITCSNDDSGGAGVWTSTGSLVHPVTSTDNVTIGSTSNLAKLAADGDTDEIQFLVQGNSSQTANLVVFEQSDGTDVFTLTNAGNLTIAGDLAITGGNVTTATTFDSTLTSTGTLTANGSFIANGAFTLGDGGDTGSVNTSDWDISTTGDLTGIGSITADGAINFTPGSTDDITFTTDADSTFIITGLTSASGSGLCIDGSNNVRTCIAGGGGSPWIYTDPFLYPDNATDFVAVGTTTTSEMHGLFTVSGSRT
ncbi:MerR family transcriptional regulator, partial [Patescibacteria group bacterium]|nr:MerR family transcriptional regulator [Patescibacteria group bacterium]